MCWSGNKVPLFIMFDFVGFDNNMDDSLQVASFKIDWTRIKATKCIKEFFSNDN